MNKLKSEVIFVHQNFISNRLTYNRLLSPKKRLHFLANLWSQSEFRT